MKNPWHQLCVTINQLWDLKLSLYLEKALCSHCILFKSSENENVVDGLKYSGKVLVLIWTYIFWVQKAALDTFGNGNKEYRALGSICSGRKSPGIVPVGCHFPVCLQLCSENVQLTVCVIANIFWQHLVAERCKQSLW